MEQLYRLHKINSENDLPKKSEIYFCLCTLREDRNVLPEFQQISHFHFPTKHWSVNSKKITVTHWLEPVEQEDKIKKAIEFVQNMDWGVMDNDVDAQEIIKFLESI